MYTHLHTQDHTYRYTHIYTCTYMHMHTYVHIGTHTNEDARTHIQDTHRHTHREGTKLYSLSIVHNYYIHTYCSSLLHLMP